MGYYSDIAIVVRDTKVKEFFDELKHQVEEYYNPLKQFNPEISLQKMKLIINDYFSDTISYAENNNKGDMLVRCEFVKWKELDPPERIIINSLLNIGIENFKFIRLGEHREDTQELGEYYSEQFELDWTRIIITRDDTTDHPIYNFKVFND